MRVVLLFWIVVGIHHSLAASLQLDDVVSSARSLYPVVVGAERDVEASRNEVTASEGAFDLNWKNRFSSNSLGFYENYRFDSVLEKPVSPWGANLFTGYRLGRGSFPTYDEKGLTLSQGEVRLGVEFSLWRNRGTDRRRTNLEKARLALTAAQAAAIQAQLEAVRTASQKYWEWVAAGKKVSIYRDLLAIAEARDKGLSERVRHGDVPEFERKDNERSILQRKGQLVTAERVFQQAAIELSLYLRDPSGRTRIPLEEELPKEMSRDTGKFHENLSADIEVALSQRPELVRLTASRDQSYVEADWADNQLAPRLDFQTAASRDLGQGSPTREGTELEASVILEIPLERRLSSGRRESARATGDRTEATLRLTKDRIVNEVRDTYSALRAAIARLGIAISETELAKKLEEGERSRFQHGDSNILFVNLREQATADAMVREVEALADFHKGVAQLKAVIGQW